MQVRVVSAALGVSIALGAAPALAGQHVYVYSVLHPSYGEIGTLTDIVDRDPEMMRVESHLRIAVRLVGIVVYRQKTDITEIMRGDRLVWLQSLTDKDGQHLEVHGKTQDGQFVVNATSGSFIGPATVAPSDPWALKHTGSGTLVYASTGTIMNAQISGGEHDTVSLNGTAVSVRHFTVTGYNREDVWLDSQGIPVKFRSVEDGTPIDFVLQKLSRMPGGSQVTPQGPATQAGLCSSTKVDRGGDGSCRLSAH